MSYKGSEWRKWDLHIHSPYTHGTANKYGSTSIDEFCNTILQNEIACIGLTNYFYITEKEFDEINSRLDGKCLVIPNFEFRVSDKNNKGDHINVHVLFNPEIGIGNILKTLSRVKIHNRTDKFCNIEDINELGLEAISVDFETLIIELKKTFRPIDDFILICPYTGYGGFKNDAKPRNGETEMKFDIHSDIIFGSKTFLTYFLNDRTYSITGNNYSITKKKTILECSDAHSLDKVNEKYTWIKADPTFEGLKQLIFEPEQRAKIQKEKPEFKEDKLIIENVKFISQSKTFTDKTIYLNENLNVIIGGKSSGKSILLYAIAKTLLPDDFILKNDDDTEKYELKKIDSDLNFEVTSKLGISQKMFRPIEENSIIPEIKYIPQNYLVKLAEAEFTKKGKSLNKLVRDLINEDSDSKSFYNEFIYIVKQNDIKRDQIIDNFFNLIEEIKTLEIELKTKSNKDVLEKNITVNSAKVDDLNKNAGLSTEDLEKYKKIQEEIEKNNSDIEIWKNDFNLFRQQILDIQNLASQITEKKEVITSSLQNNSIKNKYTNDLKFIDEFNTALSTLSDDVATEIKDGKTILINDSVFKETLQSLNKSKQNFNEDLKPFQQNLELKTQIEDLNKSIVNDKKLLSDIVTLTKTIKDKNLMLEETRKELFDLYCSNYEVYLDIIEKLKLRTEQLENDGLEIEGIAQFNFPKFYKNILDLSDRRSASYLNYLPLDQKLKATSTFEFADLLSQMQLLFGDILNGVYVTNSKQSKKEIIKILLDDYFFDFWKITYKGDKLGEMSSGKASFVILMLIIGLSQSKAPILIDQPEDNLDNRSITSDLVSYLKNKKLERQIIIVTHNANIVVNSDAENIIVANQKGQNDIETTSEFRFDYINGAIENSFEKIETETNLLLSMGIREHIADIVEGGKDAFKKRELKYRFK
ncbi:TrlF family AAA-like ATPase [Flavobacterium sp. KBS0721]|uniref:TrlF family AAA-like ATPase n=1 Tax=Flavobacterium sp. KBS0721 TaxID=1179672 RepID=UPI00098F4116|nr:hypothetical protein [Flavobacterium sp. KBS0721]QDW19010.1 hypothetical protein B0M43_0002450 [Flavobacterium sp. KBS0721]